MAGSWWFGFSMIAQVCLQLLYGLPFLFMVPCSCCIIPAMISMIKMMMDVDNSTEAGASMMNNSIQQVISAMRMNGCAEFTKVGITNTLVADVETQEVDVEAKVDEEKPAEE